MYTISFKLMYCGDLFEQTEKYLSFRVAMNAVADIMNNYSLLPVEEWDCWTITVLYEGCVVLTLNSKMF